MARLSEEHLKATPTPRPKSSRLSKLFKPSPSPKISPSASEKDIKPGFQKIGLDPADRARFSTASQEDTSHESIASLTAKEPSTDAWDKYIAALPDDRYPEPALENEASAVSETDVPFAQPLVIYEVDSPTQKEIQLYIDITIKEAIQAHVHECHSTVPPVRYRPDTTPKRLKVGPVYISDPALAYNARRFMLATYITTLFGAAWIGPVFLLMFVWRLAIILGVYEIARKECEWWDEEAEDLLLEPAKKVKEGLNEMGEDMLLRMGVLMGPVVAGMVRGLLDGDEEEKE